MVGTLPKADSSCIAKWPAVASLALVLAACGGGGGGGAPAPAPPDPPPPTPAPSTVTISGAVTYDFVSFDPGPGLNLDSPVARPARQVQVQFIDGVDVVASTRTDLNGEYSLDVEANRSGHIRVRAESIESGLPGWGFRVVDNTSADALYVLDGAVLSSGEADSQRDLHAASGWTGASYGNERAAAPFAIIDTLLVGRDFVLSADATTDFPALNVNWSPNNVASFDVNGEPDTATGEIGTSFFSGTSGIFLLGEEDVDTEEYDQHVILHEFGHYLEFSFARNDSIGGPHSLGDRLDMRVAFSEGWATAFAALALDGEVYRDSNGPQQAGAFGFSLESAGVLTHGWFAEVSVQELIYDLVDANSDAPDNFTFPFASVWSVMTGPVATTTAVTSVFPFLNAIKADHPADNVALDLLAASQEIGSISTDFGESATNNTGSADVLPIYTALTVNGPAVNLCSTDEFSSGITGATNKLSSRRFIRFTPPATGGVTITQTATSIPDGDYADPDFWVHRQGRLAASIGPPNDACTNTADASWVPGNCVESASLALTAVEHVLEIEEWTNTNADDDPEFPPIGRTCFDVTVTQPKPQSPIAITAEFASPPQVGMPLELTLSVTADGDMSGVRISLAADDPLAMIDPLDAIGVATLSAGQSSDFAVTVLPLLDQTHALRVTVTATIDGMVQTRTVAVPIRLPGSAPQKTEVRVTGNNEERVRSFTAIETVR